MKQRFKFKVQNVDSDKTKQLQIVDVVALNPEMAKNRLERCQVKVITFEGVSEMITPNLFQGSIIKADRA